MPGGKALALCVRLELTAAVAGPGTLHLSQKEAYSAYTPPGHVPPPRRAGARPRAAGRRLGVGGRERSLPTAGRAARLLESDQLRSWTPWTTGCR